MFLTISGPALAPAGGVRALLARLIGLMLPASNFGHQPPASPVSMPLSDDSPENERNPGLKARVPSDL